MKKQIIFFLAAAGMAILSLASLAQAGSGNTFDRDLFFGMRNDRDVSRLQQFLEERGLFANSVTGNFFTITRLAVQKFQRAHGIRQTGYFGPITRAAAHKILAESGAPAPGKNGSLAIEPPAAQVKVGDRVRVRAIFTPSRPACLDAVPACKIVERAPYEVQASFVSDQTNIAAVDVEIPVCASPPPGVSPVCNPLVSVRGVSPGKTAVSASYASGADVFRASVDITVTAAASY